MIGDFELDWIELDWLEIVIGIGIGIGTYKSKDHLDCFVLFCCGLDGVFWFG